METEKETEMEIDEFAHSLPKAELHVHLEGTLELSMAREFARRNGVPLPESLVASAGSATAGASSAATVSASTSSAPTDNNHSGSTLKGSAGYAFHDLRSFLAVYYPAMSVLLTSQDFHDLLYAYLVKCSSSNILHAEIFFDAQAHTGRGVRFSTIMSGLRSALIRCDREKLGVSARLILCILRDKDPEWGMATLIQSLDYKEWIIGIGLDSDERGNPPEKFRGVFERAKHEGFLITCHCDVDQLNSIDHIRQVIRDIKVDRIDHGSNIIEDRELVEEVRKLGLGLTCCPISNSVVTDDWKGKEIRELFDRGVKVTVNSDDPAYFRGYVSENVKMMMRRGQWSKEDMIKLQRNAFEVSWVSEMKRETFLEKLRSFASENGLSV